MKWNNNYKDIKINFIEKFKDYGIKIKEVIRFYKNNNQKIFEIIKSISEFELIKLDYKKAVDSTKFKQIQDSNWKLIIESMEEKRKKIKELIFSNFERLKSESDSFDKLSKPKEEIKDEMSKIIREEWYL